MTKKLKGLSLALLLVPCMLIFAACNGPLAKIDASTVKVAGIIVSVDEMTTKKSFTKAGGDSEARVTSFGALGELDCITINVAGTVSKKIAAEKATKMTADGKEVAAGDIANYSTDFFSLKIKLPQNATKLDVKDGLPSKPISKTENNVIDGYFTDKIQWLLGDAAATPESFGICGNSTTKDGYFYFDFQDSTGKSLQKYFVRVLYSVTFVA
ncbi:MAG: hypothetical protein RR400_00830 [Clostridia bacterium]